MGERAFLSSSKKMGWMHVSGSSDYVMSKDWTQQLTNRPKPPSALRRKQAADASARHRELMARCRARPPEQLVREYGKDIAPQLCELYAQCEVSEERLTTTLRTFVYAALRLEPSTGRAAEPATDASAPRSSGMWDVKEELHRFAKGVCNVLLRGALGYGTPEDATPMYHIVLGQPGHGQDRRGAWRRRCCTTSASSRRTWWWRCSAPPGGRHDGADGGEDAAEAGRGGGRRALHDEAYQLVRSANTGNDFGPKAVDAIMKEMLSNVPVIIVAGYRDKMQHFLRYNAGLEQRLSHRFTSRLRQRGARADLPAQDAQQHAAAQLRAP